MTFAHEHLLWFLLIIPALVVLKLWVDAHGSLAERLFTAARLRPALVIGRSLWRSWFVYALYALAMTCLIVAVAQPRWGEEKLDIPDKGRNVFIAIDTSRSMLARDVAPDRLTRARLAAHDLVTELGGERVGLLAFAGRAYLQAPLTTDHDAIIESLQAFDHTIIEWGGSNIGDLLDVTLRAVKTLPKGNFALVIFSDGGDSDQNLTPYLQRLTAAGIIVVTVGLGSESGTVIPNPEMEGDYVRDEAGNVVLTQLRTGVLQQLATATGGRYMSLGQQPLTRRAIQPVLDRLTEQESANRQTSRPIERFAWPLGLGMFFLMLAWIISALPRPSVRPLVLALAVVAFAPQHSAQAANIGETLASIFQSNGPTPEDARAALEGGDFKKARELYSKLLADSRFNASRDELHYGMAASEHALTNYDGSLKNFSEALHTGDTALRTRAHRGLGHSLYDQGVRGLEQQPKITMQRWTDALRHLDSALEIDPDNAELRENRDHVASMLDNLRKVTEQMEQQQQQQQGQKGQKGEKGQKGQKGQKGEKGDEKGEGDEGSDPDGSGEENESDGKGEKKEEDDGIGGKDAKELPEGRLEAAGGEPKDGQEGKQGLKPGEEVSEAEKQQNAQGDQAGDQRNPRTGFTPGEALSYLRQYMDEITAPMNNRYHTPPANKKDW